MIIHVDPLLIVFEHDDPADLFLMNPRRFGFTGPLLLLMGEDDPDTAIDLLSADYWLRRPVDVGVIERLVQQIGAREADGIPLAYTAV